MTPHPHAPVALGALVARLTGAGLVVRTAGADKDREIVRLTADSRAAAPGVAFFATRGEAADGHAFLGAAIAAGASVVVCEALTPEVEAAAEAAGTAVVVATSSRAAYAEAAALAFGDPSHALVMVGITGTNGKTTTAFLLHHLFERLGCTAGMIGTVEVRIGAACRPSTHTTPDALALQGLLREMADAGVTHVAMEVSSHALDQARTGAVRFAAAAFTNLTRDHLDYHPTFEHYAASKQRLFDGLAPGSLAVVNADDPHGAAMAGATAARVLTYGESDGADLHVAVRDNALTGLCLEMTGLGLVEAPRRYRLVGGFNAANLACAAAVGIGLGFDAVGVLDALATAPPVPGRFEQFVDDLGRVVVVDYAHTPDALENALATMRATMGEKGCLWVVFGCGGDRDAGKRPLMAAVAERLADRLVLTSDNPRTEDPEAILDAIAAGLARPDAAVRLADRRAAIGYAARQAAAGDAILVAGKGHEPYQIVGTETLHFDDREEVQALFGACPPSAPVAGAPASRA